MEHRDDLERILLNGLPEQERRHVQRTMANATAAKLAHLRARHDGASDDDADDDEDADS